MMRRFLASALAFLVGFALAAGTTMAHEHPTSDPPELAAPLPGLSGLGGPFTLILPNATAADIAARLRKYSADRQG
jgi:hypothetical protein